MTRKNKLALAVATLMSTITLASCGNVSYKTTFNPYWQTDVLQSVQTSETLTYEVTFEASANTLNNYKVKYETGSYVTALNSRVVNGETLYVYTTELKIKGEFSFEENVHVFEDHVSTRVEFKNAANALMPIESTRVYDCHSPRNTEASASTDFSQWQEKGTVSINHTEKSATIVRNPGTQREKKTTSSIYLKKEKYSYLDNEQLLVALRGLQQAENVSYNFHVYAPFTKKVQNVVATFGKKSVEENFTLTVNDTTTTADVSYFPITLVLDEKDAGSEQKLWIAAMQDVRNNTLKNVILKNIVELPYNQGTLTYTLKSATFQENN